MRAVVTGGKGSGNSSSPEAAQTMRAVISTVESFLLSLGTSVS